MDWPDTKAIDNFFKGFLPATPAPPKVTIEEIIRRGTSLVLVDGKLYRIEANEVEVQKRK
jgi:hypothetical protein